MAEQEVRLRKRTGGNTVPWGGHVYHWPADDPVLDVPYDLALELLRQPDGDYTVDGAPEPVTVPQANPGSVQSAHAAGLAGSEEDGHRPPAEDGEDEESREVTEPAPKAEHKVTEPGPGPDHPADTAARATQKAGTRRRTTPASGK